MLLLVESPWVGGRNAESHPGAIQVTVGLRKKFLIERGRGGAIRIAVRGGVDVLIEGGC